MLSACFCRVWLLVQNHSWLIAGRGDGAACLRQAITQLCLSSWRDAKALQDKHASFLLTITCHLGIQELHALGYKLLVLGSRLSSAASASRLFKGFLKEEYPPRMTYKQGSWLSLGSVRDVFCKFWDALLFVRCFKFQILPHTLWLSWNPESLRSF